MTVPALVLASGSDTRRALLVASGYGFDVHVSEVDEAAIKRQACERGDTVDAAATTLAEAKALVVSSARPTDLVIGADQILTCEGRWFDKPIDLSEARDHLRALRGRVQLLHTACVLATAGKIVWRVLAQPHLTMRAFDNATLEAYVVSEGDALLRTVGACRIEGAGALLFEAIEGERAAILGLPMLELAAALHGRDILPA